MLIRVQDLRLRHLDFSLELGPGAIDLGPDIRQAAPLATSGRAQVVQEHRGGRLGTIDDIRVAGRLTTSIELACARCLEPVGRPVEREFDLLYRPRGVDRRAEEAGISGPEAEIGYYEGQGLELEDVLREQVLLAVPMKAVCRDDCRGLCPRCGRNLNREPCACAEAADPRWSALEEWKSKR